MADEAQKIKPFIEQMVQTFLANLSLAGFSFDSADNAAIAALEEIYYKSVANRVEFAGRIFKRDASFVFTKGQTLNQRDNSDPGPKLSNVENIGTYHSHGGEFLPSDELFSPQDRLKAELAREVSYLITPRRKIMKYIPVSLAKGKPGSLGTEVILRPGLGAGTSQLRFHQDLFSSGGLQKQGEADEAVRAVQIFLNNRFPSALAKLAPDGIFGPKTLARVKEFQTKNQLKADGLVGPRTRSKLYSA